MSDRTLITTTQPKHSILLSAWRTHSARGPGTCQTDSDYHNTAKTTLDTLRCLEDTFLRGKRNMSDRTQITTTRPKHSILLRDSLAKV